jgi:aspartyl-tRNA(Asn)/glutamyl-tRNA(Gln) amidotransferase subunit A
VSPTILELAADLAAGHTTSRILTERALSQIADASGEGKRTFIRVYADQALAAAASSDERRKSDVPLSALDGIPVSIKNLFDVAGETTLAASRALADHAAAETDALVVARLRAAGAVIVGSTNMTEFAFSGLGLNPHYGTPANPVDATRIPGGSSSGAPVSVAGGMAVAALGTDTGGSVRIPAALCGLVGFKPTARRVPLAGVVPLAPSFDSIGSIASSVECCAIVDAVCAGEPIAVPDPIPLAGLRLALPERLVLDDLDPTVARAFDRACTSLSAVGVEIVRLELPVLAELSVISGGLVAAEAWAWHQDLLGRRGDDYDPRVAARIRNGMKVSAADYADLQRRRVDVQRRVSAATVDYDAIVMPTCAIVAPKLADLETPEGYAKNNILLLRNTGLANTLDRCALSVPCHATDELPVGFMLVGGSMADARLFAIGRSIAKMVRPPSP